MTFLLAYAFLNVCVLRWLRQFIFTSVVRFGTSQITVLFVVFNLSTSLIIFASLTTWRTPVRPNHRSLLHRTSFYFANEQSRARVTRHLIIAANLQVKSAFASDPENYKGRRVTDEVN